MIDTTRPRLLIEDWFPVNELGIESVRERAAASALPPVYFLHVWWARRPLVASAGAVLGSLLPAWSSELAAEFCDHDEIATPLAYQQWFLHLCGIWGDPVEADRLTRAAKASGTRIPNPYSYRQAYKNSAAADQLKLLHRVLEYTWGQTPSVCDPTSGGGSIPFEAVRYRLFTHANDLNPVAAGVLQAGVELPARYGADVVVDLQHWGKELVSRLQQRLEPFFPSLDDEKTATFIFARTLACPRTGKMVPLVGDWALRRGDKPVAVRLVTQRGGRELDEPAFEIAGGRAIDFDPKRESTWSRGKAVSPWDHLTIDSDYIKAEAQASRMGEVLYAIAMRTASGRGFRAPTPVDLNALAAAEAELERLLPQWEQDDVLPVESVPEGNKTREPQNYGMARWRDFFTPRQLLVHGCFVEEFRKLIPEVRAAIDDPDRADALLALLALMQAKGLNWNARLASWDVSRQKIRSVFDSHSYAFKNTFAEFEGGTELYAWTLNQLTDAYDGIARLLHSHQADHQLLDNKLPEPQVTVTSENAGNLASLADGSQTLVCIDPPYYDNVMYAELSDFFYVWEKRTLGSVQPELFAEPLTNKHDEAVTNRARFSHAGRRAKELADHDYTAKMAAIFAECRRVLADNGVLTVMFTHKRADAWDALGTALITAGFTVETSWPVHTESEQSLHQARQNSAKSTVFMVCRKRREIRSDQRRIYLDDIESDIRRAAGDALERAQKQGLTGVDLLLSTYGPALSALSARWPVYSAEADAEGRSRLLRPEEALAVARAEATRRLRARLVGSDTDFDPLTDFVLMAWHMFCAREFPYDEARKLALTTGGLEVAEVERAKLIVAKSGSVAISEPQQRLRREGDGHLPGVNRERRSFPNLIDAVHTALYITDQDGPAAARRWLSERGLTDNARFRDCLQALLRAVPRTRASGKWNLPEAELLDRLATTCFPDLDIPPDPLDITEQQLFSPDG